jgi:hypothetical protein
LRRLSFEDVPWVDSFVLGDLVGLEELELKGVRLRSLNVLAQLPALRRLVIDRQPLDGFGALTQAAALRSLTLGATPPTLEWLSGLPALEELELLSTPRGPRPDPSPLARVPALRRVRTLWLPSFPEELTNDLRARGVEIVQEEVSSPP